MITLLLIIGILILSILNVAFFILFLRLFQKIAIYEQWILEFRSEITNTLEKMREIDRSATFATSFSSSGKGAFESDDQVGQVFRDLMNVIEELEEKIQ